jgi:predicted O-methyltransferase YrrM
MSDVRHSQVIATLARIYKPEVYLELGVYECETFKFVEEVCDYCIGVDIQEASCQDNNENIIWACSTDEFFENKSIDKFFEDRQLKNKKVDMVFIDACHKYENVLKDFENSLEVLSDGGCIIIHDTDPVSDHYLHPGLCSDSHKIVKTIEARDDLNIVTLPCGTEGLSIITKKNKTRTQRRHEG